MREEKKGKEEREDREREREKLREQVRGERDHWLTFQMLTTTAMAGSG